MNWPYLTSKTNPKKKIAAAGKSSSAMAASQSSKLFFQTQRDHEKIKLLVRRHTITNLPWLATFFLLLSLPAGLILFRQPILTVFPLGPLYRLPKNYLLLLLIFWLQILVLYFFINFIKWYYSVLLVTNKRVLDLDLVGFLYRHTSEAELEEIQDVSHSQTGVFGTLFNFGNIYLQTAGEAQNIELLKVPKPGETHDLITNLLKKKSK